MQLSSSRENLFLSSSATVLLVEDDPISAAISSHALGDNYKVVHLQDGQSAIDQCFETPPDLVLMDLRMPGISGLEVCNELKKHAQTKDIPIIFITADSDPDSEDECWDAGCVDFISKPFSVKTLKHRVNAHLSVKLLTDKLRRLATFDGLTNIQNRRFFDGYLLDQSKLAVRQQTPLSLLMIDIDFFKQYNDTYGHLKGDDCLINVAKTLSDGLERPTDCVARYGGEEFVVVLPDTDEVGAKQVGEYLRQSIYELNIAHQDSPYARLSVSLGGVTARGDQLNSLQIIETADKHLYKAKQNGRNCLFMP